MRPTLQMIDPLPPLPARCDEPRAEPVPRHMRLPSYRELMRKQSEEAMRRSDIKLYDELRKEGYSVFIGGAAGAFNGKHDPHITEADCRKPKADAPQGPAPDAHGWAEWAPGSAAPRGSFFDLEISFANGLRATLSRQPMYPQSWDALKFAGNRIAYRRVA